MTQLRITLFTQPNCPRCPGVKAALDELRAQRTFEYRELNTATDEGMYEAVGYNLMTTPAVVIGNTVREIKLVGEIDKKRIISTLEELGA
jgi:glutaredoxin